MSNTDGNSSSTMQVLRNGSTPAIKGPADAFIGQVRIGRIFNPRTTRAHQLAHASARKLDAEAQKRPPVYEGR